MKKKIRLLLVFAVGCVLVFLSVRKLELKALINQFQDANYVVLFPVFVFSIIGYGFRSLRWHIILMAMGHRVRPFHLFSSLSIGYAINIVTPRLGELVRTVTLSKTDDVPIEQSLISVVVERVIDFICLFLVLMMATVLSFGEVRYFIITNILNPIGQQWQQLPLGWLLIAFIITGVAGYWIWSKVKASNRIKQFAQSLVNSVKQVLLLKQRGTFIAYTVCIWICYFLMTYLWFSMFDETNVLGLREALVIMAIGSVGRSVPVHGGGMGAYHFLVSNAFTLFGVSLLMGTAMAFIIHGAQLLLTFVLGVGCWIWMLVYIKQKNE